MTGTATNGLADARLDAAYRAGIVQERHVLLPRKPDHDVEPVARCQIEQPGGRHRVRAHRVEAVLGHGPEVVLDPRFIVVLATAGVRPERAVGNATQIDLAVAREQELAACLQARPDWQTLRRHRTQGGRRIRHGYPLPDGGLVGICHLGGVFGTLVFGRDGGLSRATGVLGQCWGLASNRWLDSMLRENPDTSVDQGCSRATRNPA